jgi:hypothetical protein
MNLVNQAEISAILGSEMTPIKHPEIVVELIGKNGNVFNVLGLVQEAMRKAKLPRDEMNAFIEEATSGDYDNAIKTCMKWVTVR